jgi:catechol-2,3-dioxygenase
MNAPDLQQVSSLAGVPREIGHLVLNVSDVARSTAFYRDVVGFQVSRYGPDGDRTFLTCGAMHHNLALFKAPAGAEPLPKKRIGLNHFAFKVESYEALQQAHQRLQAANAVIERVVDHGMTLSVYFHDPDGITMELFHDTFDTAAEGLAFMKATPGQAKPININAAQPVRPVIPPTDFSRNDKHQ